MSDPNPMYASGTGGGESYGEGFLGRSETPKYEPSYTDARFRAYVEHVLAVYRQKANTVYSAMESFGVDVGYSVRRGNEADGEDSRSGYAQVEYVRFSSAFEREMVCEIARSVRRELQEAGVRLPENALWLIGLAVARAMDYVSDGTEHLPVLNAMHKHDFDRRAQKENH